MMQVIGKAQWGGAFGGVLLNFIGTAPPFNFVRRLPQPAPDLVNHVVDSLCYAEESIAKLMDRDPMHWPRAVNEHDCYTRYGPCNFRELCMWGAKQ